MTKKLIPAVLAVAALVVAIPASAARETGEAKLAKMLEGRTAGAPVDCLTRFQRNEMTVVDRTALVFKVGDTYYVNRPSGVNFLTWSDVPVFKIWGSDVCSKDIVHLHDRSTGMPGASMVLDKFVPYKRVG